MNTSVKVLALAGLLAVSCSGKSDKKDPAASVTPDAPAVDPTPTPTPTPTTDPKPADPVAKGFQFVDDKDSELPLFVRGGMNGWLGDNPSEELLAKSRLNFDKDSGCYVGTLALQAGNVEFRLASYLPAADGNGWAHLKVGLGGAGTTTALALGTETKVDVYYFPAGDANGKDLGGGGNLSASFPSAGDYLFKLCTQAEDYTVALLTISAK